VSENWKGYAGFKITRKLQVSFSSLWNSKKKKNPLTFDSDLHSNGFISDVQRARKIKEIMLALFNRTQRTENAIYIRLKNASLQKIVSISSPPHPSQLLT